MEIGGLIELGGLLGHASIVGIALGGVDHILSSIQLFSLILSIRRQFKSRSLVIFLNSNKFFLKRSVITCSYRIQFSLGCLLLLYNLPSLGLLTMSSSNISFYNRLIPSLSWWIGRLCGTFMLKIRIRDNNIFGIIVLADCMHDILWISQFRWRELLGLLGWITYQSWVSDLLLLRRWLLHSCCLFVACIGLMLNWMIIVIDHLNIVYCLDITLRTRVVAVVWLSSSFIIVVVDKLLLCRLLWIVLNIGTFFYTSEITWVHDP